MQRRLLSMILAVIMLLSLSIPAFAEGEPESPPSAETGEEAPSVGEVPPGYDEVTPVEDAVTEVSAVVEDVAIKEDVAIEETTVEDENSDDGIMSISDAPVSANGVTVILNGSINGIGDIMFENPDNDETYFVTEYGIGWWECPDTFASLEEANIYHPVLETTSFPTQFIVRAGGEVKFWLYGEYGITVDNGTIIDDYRHSWYGGGDSPRNNRYITVTAPNNGTMNVNVYKDGAELARVVPYTFYNEDWENGIVISGGGDIDASLTGYKDLPDGTRQRVITTGGNISVWIASGYAIEVLKGGYVVKTQAPSGPAAAGAPAGTTDYILHVNMDADEFVIAAVKQGEHYQVPDTTEPQIEAPPVEDNATQMGGTFTDVASSAWYADTIQKAYSSGIVKGVTDTTFAPNGTTTRGQTVTMLYRAMGSPGGSNVFSDTTGEVGSAAGWASANGVTNGVSTTTFSPNSPVTREQLVTMLYRLAGSPPADTSKLASYSDGGSVQSYAQCAVAWAISNGLLTGYGDGTILPAATASRAEVCTLIMRYLSAA